MNRRRIATKTLLLLAFCWVPFACAKDSHLSSAFVKPSAQVRGVALRGFSLDSVELVINVEVSNPNPVSLPLTGFSYELHHGENRLVSGEVERSRDVGAGDTTQVQVPVRLEYDHLLSLSHDLRPGDVFPYRAEVTLRVAPPLVEPIRVPLTLQGELPIPAAPEVMLGSFRWASFSIQEARGEFTLNLHNPNPFSIRLKNMTYRLRLGGEEVAYSRLRRPVEVGVDATRDIHLSMSFSPARFGTGLYNSLRERSTGYELSGQIAMDTPHGSLVIPYDDDGWIGVKGE